MLTIEIGMLDKEKPSEEVIIYFDKVGLELLLEKLRGLEKNETDHFNLFTESWGDGELSEDVQYTSNLICHHLKLVKLNS